MDRQRHPWDNNHSIGDMGCEPRAGGRLYLLRGRLITFLLEIRATRAKKQTRREVGPARIRTIRRGAASLPARRTYVLRRR